MNIYEYLDWYCKEKDKLAISYEAAVEFEQPEEMREAVSKVYELNYEHHKIMESFIRDVVKWAEEEQNPDLKARLKACEKNLRAHNHELGEFLNELADASLELEVELDNIR